MKRKYTICGKLDTLAELVQKNQLVAVMDYVECIRRDAQRMESALITKKDECAEKERRIRALWEHIEDGSDEGEGCPPWNQGSNPCLKVKGGCEECWLVLPMDGD